MPNQNTLAAIGLLLVTCHFVSAETPEVAPTMLPRIPLKSPEEAASTFDVRPGFRLELVATEPLVMDPVAIAIDENSRAFVAEMRDYSERRSEHLGRIKLLRDSDGDGKYDHADVFAEDLPWPTAVCCWDGGVFVVASPDLLYLKDTNGDDRADVRAVVATGLGSLAEKLNVQALPNSMQWAPDGRIHLALGGNPSKLVNVAVSTQPPLELRGQDVSFDPKRFDFRAEPGGGQWGMTFDESGRKFICSNSRHIQQLVFPLYALETIPGLASAAVDIAEDGPQAEVFRASPVESWRTLRTQWRVTGVTPGLIEGGGRASGYFTSACGITIYQGDAYGPEFVGNAFIADCGSNLIHRKVLSGEVRMRAMRAVDEQTREFVASGDNWFRPVAMSNGPDGCLWVCDMYREVVEHPWSLPEPIKKHLDLNAGNDRGRLWRIVPEGFISKSLPKLGELSDDTLVETLNHRNVWHRLTAARLLYERAAANTTRIWREAPLPLVAAVAQSEKVPWTDVLSNRSGDSLATALDVMARTSRDRELSPEIAIQIAKAAASDSLKLRFQAALVLPRLDAKVRNAALQSLCRKPTTADLRNVIVALAGDDALSLWQASVSQEQSEGEELSSELAALIGKRARKEEVTQVLSTMSFKEHGSIEQLRILADGLRASGKSLSEFAPAAMIESLKRGAFEDLYDAKASREERVRAIEALAILGSEDDGVKIVGAINPESSREEGDAVIDAVDRLQPPKLGSLLLQLMARAPASSRGRVIELWRSRKALIPELLTAVSSGTITKQTLSATDIAALRRRDDPNVAKQVTELFGEVGTREAAWEMYRPALSKPASMLAGKSIFQAKCMTCHRKQGEGNAIGPDLDAVATAGKEKVLGNILEPSREITAGYAAAAVETHSGEVATGIIAAESGGDITLRIPGKGIRKFAKQEIADFQRLPKSLMPEGIEAGLSIQDMANLLEYLTTPVAATVRRLPLTQYRTGDGKIAAIENKDQWEIRRTAILTAMQEIMGKLPGDDQRVNLDPKVIEEVDCGTYVRRLITIMTDKNCALPCYLLIPKKQLELKAAPVNAVLCLHPTEDRIGHQVVVGLGGKPHRQYAAELAEQGYVTIAPAYPLLANYQPDLAKLGYVSGTMKAIWDNRRVLDYLDTLSYVKPGEYATIGHSLGGHNSVYTAVFDERLKVVVTSCGLDLYVDYKKGDITGWTSTRYMPRLLAYKGRVQDLPVDFDEIIAAVAPRAMYIVAPLKDDNFRADSVDRIVANVQPVLKLFDAETRLLVEHPDCAHDFPDPSREAAYKFIADHLGK